MSASTEMSLMNWVFKGLVTRTVSVLPVSLGKLGTQYYRAVYYIWLNTFDYFENRKEIEFRLFSLSDENAKWFLSGCIFAFFLLIAFVINNYKNNWEIRRANREAALVRQMSVKVWRSRNLSLRSTPGKIPIHSGLCGWNSSKFVHLRGLIRWKPANPS